MVAACSDDGGSGSTSSTDRGATGNPPTIPTTSPATTTTSPVALPSDPFTLGVASGDPDATGVVLWTRLAPDPLRGDGTGGMPADLLASDIPVTWEASREASFATVEHSGTASAIAEYAHSVHATVELPQGTWFYRFRVGDHTSPVGTTRPAPPPGTPTAQVRIATASCQHYETGFYAAYADVAAAQPDAVVFLGDYIYEGAGAEVGGDRVRSHVTPEPTTLAGYRDRYALYKSDPHLQAAHAACPWFVVWDDHEVENNYAGLTPQDPADAEGFGQRRLEAYQAWWEHMPVRLGPPLPTDLSYPIYRAARWGDLVGLTLLDTRQYRTDQACGDVALSLEPACPEINSEARTLTGDNQEAFLERTMGNLGTVWNVIGQQVVMTDLTLDGAVLNYDQWDGYPANRERIFAQLEAAAVPNVVVLTGDIHLAGVGLLRSTPDVAPLGVEFVTTSISSGGLVDADLTELLAGFPNVVDAELAHRGYTLHTVTPDRWVADYRIVADVTAPDSPVSTWRTFTVRAGSPDVEEAGG